MKKDLNKIIEHFISYYRDIINSVEKINIGTHGSKLKKISYIAAIDGLAKAVTTSNRNRKRFTNAVENYANWDNCKKISLPHLDAVLNLCEDSNIKDLQNFAHKEMSGWMSGQLISLEKDVEHEKLQELFPYDQIKIKSGENVKIEDLKHKNLFYTYRNLLIHEFREHNDPMDCDDENSPIYISTTVFEGTKESEHWYLFYPTAFFKMIAKNILDNIEKHLSQNEIDPTENFKSGIYWIDELRL